MLKRVPLPTAGVMLGVAALGNLLQSYSAGIRTACGVIAALLGVVLIVKVICCFESVKADLQSPAIASVVPTFTMALMLLAGYLQPLQALAAAILWYLALAGHIALIIYFTVKFMRKPVLKAVFASYFIPYVGIVVASVTAPAFGVGFLGLIIFWIGLVLLVPLLCMVGYRYLKVRKQQDQTKPFFCIFAAPTSLCLAGYMASAETKSAVLIAVLAVVATLFYLLALAALPNLLKLPFYPSYSAFTFPFVISAIAMKQVFAYLQQSGSSLAVYVNYVVAVETVFATVLVCYTLLRYLMFVLVPARAAKTA